MASKLSLEEVLNRIEDIHGNTITLDISTYFNTKTKARFIHKKYGEWWTLPSVVLNGHGHPKNKNKNSRISLEDVKLRLFKIHGDVVSIEEGTFINVTTVAKFKDRDYGYFLNTPHGVCGKGNGHPQRWIDRKSKVKITPIEEIKNRLSMIHSDVLIIKESSYVACSKKAIFIDSQYGEWESKVSDVLNGHGHPDRWLEKSRETNIKKYGVDNPSKNTQIKVKKEETCLKNYGVKHPSQAEEIKTRIRETSIERYGVDNPSKNERVSLRQAKSSNNSTIKFHWKTNEELVCQASYEAKTVDYLNSNHIDFEWQPKTFTMPNGKTYRPDMHLIKSDTWVEIKGWMRKDAQEKWDWFQTVVPNSELWNQKKLKEMGIL